MWGGYAAFLSPAWLNVLPVFVCISLISSESLFTTCSPSFLNCRWLNTHYFIPSGFFPLHSLTIVFSLFSFIPNLPPPLPPTSLVTPSTHPPHPPAPSSPCQARPSHTPKQDLLWLPLNYTPFYSIVYQSKGGAGWGYVEGRWGGFTGAPSILSINVGSPHKGRHDRGWVVIMPWPCLPLKVTPFLIALRDGR